ncbi:MAG: transposase [Deltaproteobacteria bacterium]|nr:transposase [Deltaproteobacteria bacterium]
MNTRGGGEGIAHILWELKAGKSALDVCKAYGISAEALESWRKDYGGLAPREIDRARRVEEDVVLQRTRGGSRS